MFGYRLKLARKKAGYSLRGLAEALQDSVTAQAIGKYERGEMMPSSSVLLRLSRTLGVSLEYLLSDQVEELEALEFRKLSGTRVGDRARVEAQAIDHLQRYLAVEEILDLDSAEWKASEFGNRYLKLLDEGEDMARELRSDWELGIDPIPNMTALLEERGIKVLVIALPAGVSGLTCLVRRPRHKKKIPVIIVNKDHSLERRRLTLGHELAHRMIDEDSPVDHEKASNVFAGAFLIPRNHLIREVGKSRKAFGYEELIQFKRMYRVSGAALLVRLRQIGVIDQSALAYAFQTVARGWRKDEPAPLERKGQEGRHELPRRFEMLCYWALAEQLISPGKASELLQQPLAMIEQGMKGPAEADADNRQ